MAQACLAARRQQEEGRAAAPGKHPEPPEGETSAEKARRLWIARALQQTSYISHMAREIHDNSTKTGWSIWSYKDYRRLEEMAGACRIYAEVELADLPVSEGKKAKEWLTSAHRETERRENTLASASKRSKCSRHFPTTFQWARPPAVG